MPLTPRLRFQVLQRDGFTCRYCGQRPPAVKLHVDHIVPRARGGSDNVENLQAACTTCNQGKAARSLDGIEGEAAPETPTEAMSEVLAALAVLLLPIAMDPAAMPANPDLRLQIDVHVGWAMYTLKEYGELYEGHELQPIIDAYGSGLSG